MAVSPPSKKLQGIDFQTNTEDFRSHSISLIHEKLHFLHYSVREVIYALIDVLGHFSVMNEP